MRADLGRMLTNMQTGQGICGPVYLFAMRTLPRSPKYDLVIFLESSKAFLLSSSFLTFALVDHILKIDIWLPVLFSHHRIISTVIYISNSFPKIWPHLHKSQSLLKKKKAFKNSSPNFVSYFVG